MFVPLEALLPLFLNLLGDTMCARVLGIYASNHVDLSAHPFRGRHSESAFPDSLRWFRREFHAGCPS